MSENVQTSGAPQRPTFLTVLCILSFIWSGISIIVMLLGMGVKGAVEGSGVDLNEAMDAARQANPELYNTPEMQDAMASTGDALSWPSLILTLGLILVSLYGVVKMWNLKKQGFFIYAGAAVLGLIVPLFFGQAFSFFGLVLTGIFVGLYYMNTKVMS
jgi:hypothetical protein